MTAADDLTAPASSPSPAADGPVRGQIWARYVLLEELGAGGMGAVWDAYDPELDRRVALKVLHDELLGRASQERLRDEAKAMARIAHPNVVPVFDVGEFAGRSYYTMELVRGRSVKDWLREPRPWREVVRVFVDAAHGLAALHAAGLVHRDVKPGNLLLGDDDRARIADLGIAMTAIDADLAAPIVATTTIRRAGTPAYMAPEQLRGETGDAVSDQFALGIALWEALHGRPPFDGDTIADRLAAIEAPPIEARRVPRAVDAVARRALAIDRDARFPSVAALARALDRPRHRRWTWLAGGGAAIAIGVAAFVIADARRPDPASACLSEGDLAGVWDAPTKQRIAAAFDALHVGYAAGTWNTIERGVDRYATDWQAASQVACRARIAGEPDTTAAHRAACLAQRRAGMFALIAPLSAPTRDLLDHGTALVRTLAPVADCSDPGYLVSLAASADPERARIRAELASARVANASSRPDALAAAQHTLDDARQLHDPQLEAEALVAVGRAQSFRSDFVNAVDTLAQAAAIGDTKVKLEAWAAGSFALQSLGRYPEAAQLLDLADAMLHTAPDPAREANLLNVRGTLLGREGHYEEARVQFERARDLFASLYGPDSTTQVVELKNLAGALRRLGRLPEALAVSQRALEIDRPLGDHPLVANDYREIGLILSDLQRLDEARDTLLHAVAIARATAPNGLVLAGIDADLAVVYWRRSENDAALAAQREAVAIRVAIAPDAIETLTARSTLATMRADTGDAAGAVAELRDLLAVQTKRLGERDPEVAHVHVQLGDALMSLHQLDAAVAELERAREVYAKLGQHDGEVADSISDEAAAERERMRFAAALALDNQVAAVRAHALPPEHPAHHYGELARAKDELGLEHYARAIALGEAALAGLIDSKQVNRTADARWLLANALWQANRDRPRALELARAARDDITTMAPSPTTAASLAEITAWLDARTPHGSPKKP